MTPELQAFIDHFADEDQLRSAIEGLLSKRDECVGVRNLHGKDEYGKDLIFYAPSGLGRLALNACVVKLDKISGSASDPKSGARNVLIQCNQAMDTPVLNTQGREEWVSHVYVMCPNELSPAAMQSVAGEFKGRSSQIEFICGQDFLQMFKHFWPGFIFFQPDLLSAYLETLSKELESDVNIHRLATVHGLNTLTKNKNIYVEPLLSQERGKLSRGRGLIEAPYHLQVTSIQNVNALKNKLDDLSTSLQIVEYLSPAYHRKRESAQKKLQAWSTRLDKEWSKAVEREKEEYARRKEEYERGNDVYKRRKDPPLAKISAHSIQELLSSDPYCFVEAVYSQLDQEIYDANKVMQLTLARNVLIDSASFAAYGSLLHATTTCFPTIQFTFNDLIEWSPDEILANSRNILVTGAPGFGKSSFCRNHFLVDLAKFKCGDSHILPLYFVAHSILISDGDEFEDIFIRHEVATKLSKDPHLAVRIYLDGLDEVRSIELRHQILMIMKRACSADGSRYHCVATARDHVGGYWTNWLIRVRLSPMSPDKLRDLVTAWLDGDSGLISRFYSELKHSESLLPVLDVPLLATLTVLVFKNLRRLPENRLRLYQMFIDLLLGGWNLAKGLQRSSAYSSTVKMVILTRLAGMMQARMVKECAEWEILLTLNEVAPKLKPQIQLVVSELVEDGLLLPTGRSSYTFPHLSFQEYLAAKDALDPSRDDEGRIVEAYLGGNDWYKEVAIFIVCMTTAPVQMRRWIVDRAKPYAPFGEQRATYLIAKLLEAFPSAD